MDDMLDDVIVEPVLQEMTGEVAMETLKYYGNKLKRKETREVGDYIKTHGPSFFLLVKIWLMAEREPKHFVLY